MRWTVIGVIAVLFSLQAAPPTQPKECDPDLFRKNAQIFSGDIEFLYWTVTEGDLDYALQMQHPAWGSSPSFAQGNFQNATYDLDPGFRLAFRYFRAPHFWEMSWQYTRMTNVGDNVSKKPSPDQAFLTGTWPQILTAPLAQATSHIHLNYNVFDWTVDRVFFPNPHLRLRVIGGATTAWMSQNWTINYHDAASNTTAICNRWHFFGGGLKTGTVVDWYWTGDLYMTGASSFGVLMGSYSNWSKQTTTVQLLPTDNPAIPIRGSENTSWESTHLNF